MYGFIKELKNLLSLFYINLVENLGNETYKKINIELAENLIRKKVLDQFSFNKAFTYLICAERI